MRLERVLEILYHLDGYVEGDRVYWTEENELAIREAIVRLEKEQAENNKEED